MSGSGTEVDSDNKGDTIQVIIGLKCKNSSVTACAKSKICQKRSIASSLSGISLEHYIV